MPPELLELASVAVCHSFHSIDWYKYMSNKLPLAADGFSLVQALKPGEALMFAAWAEFGSGMSQDVDVRHRKRGTPEVWSDEDDEDADEAEERSREGISCSHALSPSSSS